MRLTISFLAVLVCLFIVESPIFAVNTTVSNKQDDVKSLPRPTKNQAQWQDYEIGIFYHYDMNAFIPNWNHRKYDNFPKPEIFNPTKLNVNQWMEVAKSLDAKYAVLTATHGSGFMLWQSDAYPYGMKQSPYMNGKGDIVKDFVTACRTNGVEPGLYCHMRVNGWWQADHPGVVNRGKGGNPELQAKYAASKIQQVKELWGNYGKLAEIWFDGGLPDSTAGFNVMPYAKKLQPNAMIYGGGEPKIETIRWVGWEKGKVGYPCWSTGTNPFDTKRGSPDEKDWCPGEADVDILGGDWMWSPEADKKLLTVDQLMDIYYKSVGHNCNLLINAAPGTDGLISQAQLDRFKEFGQEIKRRFGKSVAEKSGKGDLLELNLKQSQTIDHVILMEQITKGERVREYTIEGKIGTEWKKIGGGSCIGHKRIERFDPVEVRAVRLKINRSVGTPLIRKFAIYNTTSSEVKPKLAPEQVVSTESLKGETPEKRAERMRWFTEGRFGMFIHWGVYSVPAGEYNGTKGGGEWLQDQAKIPASKYELFAKDFNPVKFDAKEWVRIAKDAGMKYIVITAKHHDGFSMYRSDLTNWGIKSTPFQRDPLKELASACKEADMKLCFYYSIMDWHHPEWADRKPYNDLYTNVPIMDRYTEFMKGQLKELLTRYGPIGILWFDGDSEKPWTQEAGYDLYYYLRSIQPNLIVNNRVAKARDIPTTDPAAGDFGTPEQRIPKAGQVPTLPWESCMTINEHWGFDKSDHDWKSSRTIVSNLVDCAGKGGNYLLNVGPTSEGLIPPESVVRLKEVGEWMRLNGEAVYGTQSPHIDGLPSSCHATQKGDKIYLHLFEWPEKFIIPMNKNIKKAYFLLDPKQTPLAISTESNFLYLTLPKENPGKIATVVCLEIDTKISTTTEIKTVKADLKKDPIVAGTIWRSEQPADCPFAPSTELSSFIFTSKHAEYTHADTWYPSWASDGNLYSPWTDGKVNGLGVFSGGRDAATGQATIIGDDPLQLKFKNQAIYKSDPSPYGGRYPCGSLFYNGVWYYGTYCLIDGGKGLNWDILGPFVGFRTSTDQGKNWVQTPNTPAKPIFPEPQTFKGPVRFGSPHFVDFGKNMEHSPDGKAYLVGHGATKDDKQPRDANASWITGDKIFITRVKPSIQTINDGSKYEFFAGNNASGKAIWTSDFKKIKPIATWNNNMGCVTMTYNAPLKKYLMCITDGGTTMSKYNTYILESSQITGPWKMVKYLKNFGEAAYFVNIPSKFISPDGLTMWLCYSANWMDQKNKRYKATPDGSAYSMCLQEIKLQN